MKDRMWQICICWIVALPLLVFLTGIVLICVQHNDNVKQRAMIVDAIRQLKQ